MSRRKKISSLNRLSLFYIFYIFILAPLGIVLYFQYKAVSRNRNKHQVVFFSQSIPARNTIFLTTAAATTSLSQISCD